MAKAFNLDIIPACLDNKIDGIFMTMIRLRLPSRNIFNHYLVVSIQVNVPMYYFIRKTPKENETIDYLIIKSIIKMSILQNYNSKI